MTTSTLSGPSSPDRRAVLLAGASAAAGPFLPPHAAAAGADEVRLFTNPFGFATGAAPWLLAVHGPAGPGPITLSKPDSDGAGQTIASEQISAPSPGPKAGLFLSRITFPDLVDAGAYGVRAGAGAPVPVLVSDGLWHPVLATCLRGFYFQRCGVALSDPSTGLRHRPCHTEDMSFAESGAPTDGAEQGISAMGGWHTGASYDKSVAETAFVIGMVLSTYADHPEPFTDGASRIPESANGRPDVIDEMIIGLEWFVSLQRADGAFHGGVFAKEDPGPVMPHDDAVPRRLAPARPAATGQAVAALALGAATVRVFDPIAAKRYKAAALRGWSVLKDPANGPWSGQIWTPADWSARLWALSEVALLTREPALTARLAEAAGALSLEPPRPEAPAWIGLIRVLDRLSDKTDPQGLRTVLKERLATWAQGARSRARLSVLGLASHRFPAGSTLLATVDGVFFCHAFEHLGQTEDLAHAQDQLHYCLGRNPLGLSLVSGLPGPGGTGLRNLAHPMSRASGQAVPGFLVAGPHEAATDGRTPTGLGPLSHADHYRATDSNAPHLPATATLAALAARLLALEGTGFANQETPPAKEQQADKKG